MLIIAVNSCLQHMKISFLVSNYLGMDLVGLSWVKDSSFFISLKMGMLKLIFFSFFPPDYSEDYNALTEEIYLPGDYGPLDTWNRSEIIWTTTNSTSKDFWDNMGNIWMPGTAMPGGMATPRPGIQCIPEPGPFLPCNDLFDWWTLRCSVWIVFLLALLGKIFHKVCILE